MKAKKILSFFIALSMLVIVMSYTVSADTNISQVRLSGLEFENLQDIKYGSTVSVLTSSVSVDYPSPDTAGNKPFGVGVTVQRYENDAWADYGKSTFIDGTYRLKLHVYTSSDCDIRYAFVSKPTIKYNNVACTVDSWAKYSATAYTTGTFNVKTERYYLNIAGTYVTSANADDVLGDGVFSYDPGSQVLTVNGDCTFAGDDIIHNFGVKGLIINVAGDSVLHGSVAGSCLDLYTNTYITGKGKLTLIHDDYAGISSWYNTTIEIVNADIDVSAKTYAVYFFNDSDGKLKVTDSKLNLHGGTAAIYNFQQGVLLSGCSITTPTGYKISGGTVYESNGTTKAKDVVISPEEYNLTIAGVKVTSQNRHNILAGTAQGDGGFQYNPSTNTLIVSKSIMSSNTIISSKISGLTIELKGDISFAGNTVLYTEGVSTTITGGSLDCNSTKDYPLNIAYAGTLTLKDTFVTGSMTGNGHNTKLVIDNSDVVADNGIVNFNGGITLKNGIRVVTPENAIVGTSVFENDGTTKATDVYIGGDYDLWIKGEQVKNINASDILGDGVLKYDAGTKTLTINGNVTNNNGYVIESYIDGLKVNVTGDSVINSGGHGVQFCGDTEITGSGKLTVDVSFMAIYVNKGAELTIKDADITAGGKYGITANPQGETLKIINSKVNTTGSYGGGISDFAGITVEDCYIVMPKDAEIKKGSICESDGTKAKSVLIDTVNHDMPVSVKSVENQKVYFHNGLSESIKTKVIIAFYDSNGKLINVKTVANTMSPGGNMVSITTPQTLGIAKVKIFAWSQTGNIKPLSYVYEIN